MLVVDKIKTGQKLGYLRTQHGYSQQQVTNALNLGGPHNVSHWENGKNLPRIDVLVNLMHLYGIERLEDILVIKKMEEK